MTEENKNEVSTEMEVNSEDAKVELSEEEMDNVNGGNLMDQMRDSVRGIGKIIQDKNKKAAEKAEEAEKKRISGVSYSIPTGKGFKEVSKKEYDKFYKNYKYSGF